MTVLDICNGRGRKKKMKDFKNSKIIKVKCDFCGKDMECPEDMLKTSKGHMCYMCFKNSENIKNDKNEEFKNIHIDIPMEEITDTIAENFADAMVEEVFKNIWSEKKMNLKELSKKELSKEMFGAGVYMGIQAFMDSMHETEKIYSSIIVIFSYNSGSLSCFILNFVP